MENPYSELPAFENSVGSKLEIFLWYQSIIEDFDIELANWLWERGTKVELAFEPRIPSQSSTDQPNYRLRNISSGQHDEDLYRWANQLKNFGRPVYFRPMSEMNGNWTSWAGEANGNSPADFIPAWQHIHDIFTQVGATNVVWVWSPNRDGDEDAALSTFTRYYPGANYVDYVGLNGYNWGSMYNTPSWNSEWQNFDEVFGPSYRVFTRLTDKPIVIAETASTDVGGSKAQWIKDSFLTARAEYPRIKAIVWFNINKETDWRIESSAASLNAFRHYAF
jgi:beta-mannanase